MSAAVEGLNWNVLIIYVAPRETGVSPLNVKRTLQNRSFAQYLHFRKFEILTYS